MGKDEHITEAREKEEEEVGEEEEKGKMKRQRGGMHSEKVGETTNY